MFVAFAVQILLGIQLLVLLYYDAVHFTAERCIAVQLPHASTAQRLAY
jgi:hypothetical protein